jgi:predicted histidine transporter YuiF (NhaC family)
MYEGEMSYAGKARGINGFLFFIFILLIGVGLGAAFAVIPPIMGVAAVSFGVAMALKFLVVFLSVFVACRLGVGWMGKKFNDAVAHQMAAAH